MMQNPDTTSPADPAPRSSRSALLIVFLVVFIDLLGFGIVLPLLPQFARTYVAAILPAPIGIVAKANDEAPPEQVKTSGRRHRPGGTAGFILGVLMAIFSFMQFIFAPIWGRLSDRIGRRPILLMGLAGSVVFYALFGYACSLPATAAALALSLFFVARIGAGVAGATISTAQAVIADCTPPERRKHGMALIGMAFGLGFTFGPLIGSASLFFSATDPGSFFSLEPALTLEETRLPERTELIGYSAAGLSLIALLLGLWLLPETRRFEEEPPLKRKWLDFSALRFALASKAIGPVVLAFFLSTLGFGGFEATLSLLLGDAFRLAPRQAFLIFAFIGVVLLVTQGGIYRRLASRVSEVTFMGVGMLFMAAGVGVLGYVSYLAAEDPQQASLALLFTGLTAAVVGFAFLTPSAQALISRRTPGDRQGEILGVNQSASALARILGPVFGITLYELTSNHLLPYLLGATLLALMLFLLPVLNRGTEPAAA